MYIYTNNEIGNKDSNCQKGDNLPQNPKIHDSTSKQSNTNNTKQY